MKRLIKVLIFALAAFCIGKLLWEKPMCEADSEQGKETVTEREREVVAEREEKGIAEKEMQAGYVYSTLDSHGQKLYREIYEAIVTFSDETEVSAKSAEEMRKALEYVLADHPEIFYIDGFDSISCESADGSVKFLFHPVYSLDKEEIPERQKKIRAAAGQILGGMPQSSDDYVRIKYLYEYLIQNTEYKLESRENQSLVSALLYHESVCQGYAKAFQYLCQMAGMQTVLVSGTADGAGHAWTIVNSNGSWYHTDPTWGDVVYRQTEGGNNSKKSELPQISYDYLLITTEQIQKSHTMDVSFPVPVCDETADNFYIREGLLLKEFSEEAVDGLFCNALEQGCEYLTFKCSDMTVYKKCRDMLIMEQKVFAYLPETDNMIYSESPDQLTMTFWLKAK